MEKEKNKHIIVTAIIVITLQGAMQFFQGASMC